MEEGYIVSGIKWLYQNNNLYIIEIGCFNSVGFYGNDIEKIVFDVSSFMEFMNS